MPLPETIPVRYTEEEAGYVSFRPVVRQTFRLNQLVDMVLSVAGKDSNRVRQILRSGTVVFHFYRYWWQGFEASAEELAPILATFPDSDPSRDFDPARCTKIVVESGAGPARRQIEIQRSDISHKTLLQRRSFWDAVLAEVPPKLVYGEYSYAQHGDLYCLQLSDESRSRLEIAASKLAPRGLRKDLQALRDASQIILVCPYASIASSTNQK